MVEVDVDATALFLVDIDQTALFQPVDVGRRPFYSPFHHAQCVSMLHFIPFLAFLFCMSLKYFVSIL